MSGLYFIAAGSASRNREKSLDQSLRAADIADHLSREIRVRFSQLYGRDQYIYAWGANRLGNLSKLQQGDFVVDVKNKKVVQIFQFGFWFKTENTRIQEFIGWDAELAKEKRRPYKFIYFLTNPASTIRTKKSFFQGAFDKETNQNWLVGQTRFSDSDVRQAMARTNTRSIEDFLGIATSSQAVPQVYDPPITLAPKPGKFERPSWLLPAITQIEELRSDPNHQERDHEDAVSRFFECLGYQRGKDIKYRRGYVDILIEHDQSPLIVIEVKRDWSLSRNSTSYIQQAFNYALENGAQYVTITNGDKYVIFDREKGLKLDDQMHGDFQLTCLDLDSLNVIVGLQKTKLFP